MILHDAMPETEGEELLVDAAAIKDAGPEHRTPVEGTRIVLDNGDQLIVKESVEEINALIAEESKK
jgi:uncharacterized protein YlzI (FlbEa/FlbD family)